MIKLKGIAASRGIGVAKAYMVGRDEMTIPKRKISYDEISKEIYKLEEALIDARKEIISLQKDILKDLGFDHAKIFEAHVLVLEDRLLIEDVISRIKKERVNVEYAFSESIKKYIGSLSKIEDPYLRERIYDIKDVSKRVMRKILRKKEVPLSSLKERVVIVAHDLAPSETAALPKKNIAGFVTDVGGTTSHTAIIARTLGIPAVVGVQGATENIHRGDGIIVDGTEGLVVVKPTTRLLESYQKKIRVRKRAIRTSISQVKTLKAQTKDDKEVIVSANIELPEEIVVAHQFGCQGVGLYRTEYMFLGRHDFPSEEEQYQAYLNVARKVKPDSVIIRTIDIGGDKFLSQPDVPHEMRPFLGWRAIRFCLAKPELFKVQLRAILRASLEGNIKVMFPMISGVEELREARRIMDECKKELSSEGKKYDKRISVGTMIEIPAAAITADALAKESDFFSIGTNDLIQYSLAVDRANEKVAYLYEPAHPAILRLVKTIVDAGHRNNIWVGICGEMAGEPLFAFLLLGLGLDEFSMPPPRIPSVKELIRGVRFEDAQEAARAVIDLATPGEVEKYIQDTLKKILKDKFYTIIGG